MHEICRSRQLGDALFTRRKSFANAQQGQLYSAVPRTLSRCRMSLTPTSVILRSTLNSDASASPQRVSSGGSNVGHSFPHNPNLSIAMTVKPMRRLQLESLHTGFPGATPEVTKYFTQACVVGFTKHAHSSGIELKVSGSALPAPENVVITWTAAVMPKTMRSWADPIEAVENGACAIAFLLALEYTPYTIIERSFSPTGFDYWLGEYRDEIDFTMDAFLEISGIWKGPEGAIKSRVKTKSRQVNASKGLGYPAYIAVVEFGEPAAQLEVV